MKLSNDCTLAYAVPAEAWYRDVVRHDQPSVSIMATALGGGVEWEFDVEEHDLGRPTLRLLMFGDSWDAFVQIPEFFAALRERSPRTVTALRELLDELGARDETKRQVPMERRNRGVTPMNYVKFSEINDWEGETWHFWIPAEGNEEALKALQSALGESEEYELDLTPVPESEVDVLVKHTDSGYMAYHNKLSGALTLTAEDLAKIESGDVGSDDDGGEGPLFYKGKIRGYLQTRAPDGAP